MENLKQTRKQNKQWTETSRPLIGANVNDVRPADRCEHYKQSTIREQRSDYLPKNSSILIEQQNKSHNRTGFRLRMTASLPEGVKTKSEISPMCDLRIEPHLSLSERLEYYSRKHKCVHMRQFNRWNIEKERYVKFSCDHVYERISRPTNIRCRACSAPTNELQRICGCVAYCCTRCKRGFYPHDRPETEFFERGGVQYLPYDKHTFDMFTILSQLSMDLGSDLTENFSWKKFDEVSSIELFLKNYTKHGVKLAKKKKTKYLSYANAVKATPQGGFDGNPFEPDSYTFDHINPDSESDIYVDSSDSNIPLPNNFSDIRSLGEEQGLTSWLFGQIGTSVCSFASVVREKVISFITAVLEKVKGVGEKHFKALFIQNKFLVQAITFIYNILDAFKEFFQKLTMLELVLLVKTIKNEGLTFSNFFLIFSQVLSKLDYKKLKFPFLFSIGMPLLDLQKDIEAFLSGWARSFKQVIPQGDGWMDVLSSFCTTPFLKIFSKSFSAFCKDINPIFSAVKHSIDIGKTVKRAVSRFFGFWLTDSRDWLTYQLSLKTSPIRNLTVAALEYTRCSVRDDAKGQVLAQDRAKRLLETCYKFAIDEGRHDGHVIKFFNDIEKLLSHVAVPTSRDHEPFCVKIVGQPGVGKSSSVPALFGMILGTKTKEEFDARAFNRGMSEFWDGCQNRDIIVYDDFGADRKDEKDYRELLTLVSCAPFMPNFASLTGANPKGTTLDPKIVVLCSNVVKDEPITLQDGSALDRRFHVVLHTSLDKHGETVFKVTGGSYFTHDYVGEHLSTPSMAYVLYKLFANFNLRKSAYYEKKQQETLTGLPPLINNGKFEIELLTPEVIEQINSFKDPRVKPTLHRVASRIKPQGGGWIDYGTQILDAILRSGEQMSYYAHFAAIVIPQISLFNYCFTQNFSVIRLFKLVGVSIAVPSIICLISSCFSKLRSYTKDPIEPQSVTHKGKANLPVVVTGPIPAVAQSEILPQSGQIHNITPIVMRNTFSIRRTDGVWGRGVNGIFLRGTYAIIPEHFFIDQDSYTAQYIRDDSRLVIILPFSQEEICINFKRKNLITFPTTNKNGESAIDLVIYQFPNSQFNQKRDIVHFFWNGDYSLNSVPGLFVDYIPPKDFYQYVCELTSKRVAVYETGRRYYSQSLMESTHPSRSGACGNPIYDGRGTTNSPILGVHIAADTSTDMSLCLLVTRQMLESVLPNTFIHPPVLESEHTTTATPQGCSGYRLLDGNLELVGTLKRRLHTTTKTQIEPSELYDKIFPHTTEPAVLSSHDNRIPLGTDMVKTAISKLTKRPLEFDPELLERAERDMGDFYGRCRWIGEKRVLSLDEALNGSLEFPHLNSLDLTTSPGYPYTLKQIKRTDLFERINEKIVPKELFLQSYQTDFDLLTTRHIPQWISVATLKDERRPLTKIYDTPASRLFAVCSLNEIIFQKQLYGAFFNMLLDNQNTVPYAGGVDRLGSSWNTLFLGLRSVSDLGFGGDYKHYDAIITKAVKTAVQRVATLHIEKNADWKIIDEVLQEASSTRIYAIEDVLLEAVGTVGSGEWGTQLFDSLANELFFRMAWYELVPVHFKNPYYFETYFRQRIMGDDNLNAINRYLSQYYNGQTFSLWLKQYGITYTPPSKVGDVIPLEPIEDISFLKNTTGKLRGLYTPIMEWDAAVEPLNWIRKNDDLTRDQRTEMNANCVLRAVFFYGPEIFNDVRGKILLLKPKYRLHTYGYLMSVFMAYGHFPGSQAGENSVYDYGEIYSHSPIATDDIQHTQELEKELKATTIIPQMEKCFNLTPKDPSILDGRKQIMAEAHKQMTHDDNQKQDKKNVTQLFEAVTIDECFTGTCGFCNQEFRQRNRFLDHLVANHQETVPESTLPLEEILISASVPQLRTWYTELQKTLTKINPPGHVLSVFVQRILSEAPEKTADFYQSINVLLAEAKRGTFSGKYRIGTTGIIGSCSCLLCDQQFSDFADLTSHTKTSGHLERLERQHRDKLSKNNVYKDMYLSFISAMTDFESGTISQTILSDKLSHLAVSGIKPQGGDPHSNNKSEVSATNTVPVVHPIAGSTLNTPYDETIGTTNQLGYVVNEKNLTETVVPVAPGGPNYAPNRAERSMNDINWDLQKMLKKWSQVGVIEWKITDAAGTVLKVYDVIEDLLLNSLVASPFQNFQNFRCSLIRFKLLLVGSKFHQGRLLVGFYPSMAKASELSGVPGATKNLIEIGAVQLDPSVGSDIEYPIQYRHPKGHLDLLAKDCLGQLYVKVLNPLQATAGASTSVSLKILFCLDDAEFKIPRASVGTFRETTKLRTMLERIRENHTSKKEIPESDWEEIVTAIPQGDETQLLSINDMTKCEATPLGPVRAQTGDGEVPHFGEAYTTLRDICKRYRKIETSTFKLGGKTSITTSLAASHWWKAFSPSFMYALLRGPINFKITLSAYEISSNGLPVKVFGYVIVDSHSTAYSGLPLETMIDRFNGPVHRFSTESFAEFSIPFLNHAGTAYNPSVYTQVDLQRFNDYLDNRYLYICVSNPLPTDIDVTIETYVAFGDETSLGVYLGPLLMRVNPGNYPIDGWKPAIAEQKKMTKARPQGGGDFVSGIVSTILDRVQPEHVISDLVEGLLDKPQISSPPGPFKKRDMDYLTHAVGPGFMDKLQLYPAAQQLIDPEHFGSPLDEMAIKPLITKRRSLLSTFSWKTTDPVGAVLFYTKVGPMLSFPDDSVVKTFRPVLLDVISHYFAHWRGGITFTFDVVTSAFHEGKFEVTYHPNKKAYPPTYDSRVSQYVAATAIKNTSNVSQVTCQFLSETPFKKVWNGFPLSENGATSTGLSVNDYFSGVLTVTVANALRAPSTVVPNVDVNVYVQAADDFELCNMTLSNHSLIIDSN